MNSVIGRSVLKLTWVVAAGFFWVQDAANRQQAATAIRRFKAVSPTDAGPGRISRFAQRRHVLNRYRWALQSFRSRGGRLCCHPEAAGAFFRRREGRKDAMGTPRHYAGSRAAALGLGLAL